MGGQRVESDGTFEPALRAAFGAAHSTVRHSALDRRWVLVDRLPQGVLMAASDARPDTVVIGGGLVGLSVALRLAERGRSVTVLDAGRLLGGTTLATYAGINTRRTAPRAYFDLHIAGMREHERLADELGGGDWVHRGGDLHWEHGEAGRALEVAVGELRAHGYPAELIDSARLEELVPGAAPVEDGVIAWFPDDFWIDPVVLGARIAMAARAAGVVTRTNARVVALERRGDRVEAVRLADGSRWPAATVVLAGGPASDELARLAGASLPMTASRGLLAYSQPAPVTLARIFRPGDAFIRPDGAGRLLLAATSVDRELRVNGGRLEPAEAAERILLLARRALPALEDVAVEAVRLGARTLTGDGLPAVGYLPAVENVYVVVANGGIVLGPLLARLAADELTGEVPEHPLGLYRPSRFAVTPAGG